MILLDHPLQLSHEAASLFSNWEFWVAAITVMGGMVGSYIKQLLIINKLTIEVENMDEKYEAKIKSVKERADSDRQIAESNHEKLWVLCTEINVKVANIVGRLDKS